MVMQPLLFAQALLLYTFAPPHSGFGLIYPAIARQPNDPATQLPVDNDRAAEDRLNPPHPAAVEFFAWQPRSTATSAPLPCLQIPPFLWGHSGHAAATNMVMQRLLFAQALLLCTFAPPHSGFGLIDPATARQPNDPATQLPVDNYRAAEDRLNAPHPATVEFFAWHPRSTATSAPLPCLKIPPFFWGHSGHAAATNMVMQPFLFALALLLCTFAPPHSGFGLIDPAIARQPNDPATQLSVDNDRAAEDRLNPPHPATVEFFSWQPRSTATSAPLPCLQIPPFLWGHSGHAAATNMVMQRLLFAQALLLCTFAPPHSGFGLIDPATARQPNDPATQLPVDNYRAAEDRLNAPHPATVEFFAWHPRSTATSAPLPCLKIPPFFWGHSGHAAATNMVMQPLLFALALLLCTFAPPHSGFGLIDPAIARQPNDPATQLSVDNDRAAEDRLNPPHPATVEFFSWQPRSTATSAPLPCLQIPPFFWGHSGHAAATNMCTERHRKLFLVVN
ncbi:hypothetical protein V5799_024637 [Amblyomma americanum]|uniref:Secreted protein n=1 Tax=Amblyomma americanum TaxID=6943 RepID=A0AAQ4EBH1_AMBAM